MLVRLARAVVGDDHDRATRLASEAETLAGQITDPDQRQERLTRLAEAVAAGGDHDRAEMLARQITNSDRRWETLTRIVEVAGASGDHDRAARLASEVEALLGQITEPDQRRERLTRLAEAVAAGGDHDRAEMLTELITNSFHRGQALVGVALAVGADGDRDRAARLASEAKRLIGRIKYPLLSAVLARLAKAVAAGGDRDRTARLASEAEMLAGQVTEAGSDTFRSWVLLDLVEAIAAVGNYDQAETLTTQITEEFIRANALAGLTEVVATGGDRDRAARLASEAERLTGQIAEDYVMREYVWPGAVRAAAASGDYDRAEVLTGQITNQNAQEKALTGFVKILMESHKKTLSTPEPTRSSSPQMVRARRLLAEALVTGSWPKIIASLARVDPPVVTVLADGLQARWEMKAAIATEIQTADDHREPGGSRRTTQWVRGLLRQIWGKS